MGDLGPRDGNVDMSEGRLSGPPHLQSFKPLCSSKKPKGVQAAMTQPGLAGVNLAGKHSGIILNENCGLPGSSDGKDSACNAGDQSSIPGLGRSPGEGNGNPLQYSCLENPWTEKPSGLHLMGSQRVGHN